MSEQAPAEWLRNIGWKVHELVRRPELMQRFREMVEEWFEDRQSQCQKQRDWQMEREAHFRSHFSWSVAFADHARWFDESAGPPDEDYQFEVYRYTIQAADRIAHGTEPIWCWFPPHLCWSQEPQVDSPLSFTLASRDYGIGIDSRRPLTWPERYALLAAIHDRCCSGVEKIKVAGPDYEDDRQGYLRRMPYAQLQCEVSDLQDGDRPAVEAFLTDVTDHSRCQPTGASHSEDFTSADWYGTRYVFSKGNQAQCVRYLWEAFESGGHGLSQETIGEKIGFGGSRFELAKVFRKRKDGGGYEAHGAWGTMIQKDAKGSFRLAAPIPA